MTLKIDTKKISKAAKGVIATVTVVASASLGAAAAQAGSLGAHAPTLLSETATTHIAQVGFSGQGYHNRSLRHFRGNGYRGHGFGFTGGKYASGKYVEGRTYLNPKNFKKKYTSGSAQQKKAAKKASTAE